MPRQQCSLRVPAGLAAVAGAAAGLRAALPARLPAAERDLVELAFTEILTNIARHGMDGLEGGAEVSVTCLERTSDFVLEIRDRGRPIPAGKLANAGPATFDFDPTDLGGLPEDGLGLSIIKSAFDELAYSSAGGTNVLVLRKRLPPEGAT